jgi:hypothetical protein
MISIIKVLSEADAYYQPGTKIPLPPRPVAAQQVAKPAVGTQQVAPVSAQQVAPVAAQVAQQPHVVTVTTPQVQQPIPQQVIPQQVIQQPVPQPVIPQTLATAAKPAGMPTFIKPPAKLTTAEHGNAIAQKGIKTASSVASDATTALSHGIDAHPGIAAGVAGALGALGINKLINRNKPNQ